MRSSSSDTNAFVSILCVSMMTSIPLLLYGRDPVDHKDAALEPSPCLVYFLRRDFWRSLRLSSDRDLNMLRPSRRALSVFLFWFFWAPLSICQTQPRSVLCTGGGGILVATSPTRAQRHVRPGRDAHVLRAPLP